MERQDDKTLTSICYFVTTNIVSINAHLISYSQEEEVFMVKHIRRLVITLVMLIVASISTSTMISAKTEEMQKDKTNKIKCTDDLEENSKYIKESLAAGKSLTYKIEVNKGTLYIDIKDNKSFKVEVYNSKNKKVKKIEAYELYGGAQYIARDGVGVSKGKYKIKISPLNKDSALNIDGTIAMLKNGTSRTIALNTRYLTAVTEGKNYKYKFELNEKTYVGFTIALSSYVPELAWAEIPRYRIVNSKGKTVAKFYDGDVVMGTTLEKGTYTLVVEANMTGYLSVKVL